MVDDLIFLSKIQQTAHQVGVPVEPVEPSKAVERITEFLVHSIKTNPATSHVQVMGFLSHVQSDLAAAARAAGCDFVMPRSAFSQQLPQLLLQLAG